MELFYHGSSVLFNTFDLSHALEGDGKCKFGYGVYVTQKYDTAVHYSACGRGEASSTHYVYTIEVPEQKADNHIWSNKPVHTNIIKRAEEKLGEPIPIEVCKAGKLFRKYIGNKVLGRKGTVKQLSSKAYVEAEKTAAGFLLDIGVDMLIWPYNQRNPDGEQNRAILNDNSVHIVRIEQIQLDARKRLIPNSAKDIAL